MAPAYTRCDHELAVTFGFPALIQMIDRLAHIKGLDVQRFSLHDETLAELP